MYAHCTSFVSSRFLLPKTMIDTHILQKAFTQTQIKNVQTEIFREITCLRWSYLNSDSGITDEWMIAPVLHFEVLLHVFQVMLTADLFMAVRKSSELKDFTNPDFLSSLLDDISLREQSLVFMMNLHGWGASISTWRKVTVQNNQGSWAMRGTHTRGNTHSTNVPDRTLELHWSWPPWHSCSLRCIGTNNSWKP